ncbi:MAG: von Willebrand factor type A domain-containing protein [Bacteroidetes bacterium]|nr:von Willebrand factor type A domain-containing protein [Bacteroidota bacterium]
MKKHIILLVLFLHSIIQTNAQSGGITGKITDEKGEPVIGALVKVLMGGLAKGATQSDEDGNYIIKPLAPGNSYELEVRYINYKTHKTTGIIVIPDKNTKVDVQLELDNSKSLKTVTVKTYKKPLVSDREVRTAEEIEKLPTRSTNAVVSTTAGVYQRNDNGAVNLGGARNDGTAYIIDGVRAYGSRGTNLSQSSVDQIQVAPQAAYKSRQQQAYYNPSNESYKKDPENDFKTVKASPLSTMGVDVDRASYSNVRRFINAGQTPPADAVRIEEMVNYFDYNYPQPKDDKPIAIVTELTTCPWNAKHKLLHIGMQAVTVSTANLPPSNLVFLVDVSGSMDEPNKLPLVKQALMMLINQLREEDKVSIVVYAGNAGLVLESTPGNQKNKIRAAIDRLEAGGSTAGGAGIKLAYKIAVDNFVHGGNNRVILATDGDFNVGVSGDNELEELIVKERAKGVYLTCLGYGMGNYKDSKMEVLADKGNGNYSYIDNADEAEKTLVKEFGGTLFTVAKDVKSQIEFNPAKVQAYRLVGYENRLLNTEDFEDDKKDAGDMGSGHTVTILYEIIPTGIESDEVRHTPYLKYQNGSYPTALDYKNINNGNEVATIKFRYKKPNGSVSKEMVHVIGDDTKDINSASENTRFASSVAMFGMLLKNSQYKGNCNYEKVLQLANKSRSFDKDGYRAEFISLVKKVKKGGTEVAGLFEEE